MSSLVVYKIVSVSTRYQLLKSQTKVFDVDTRLPAQVPYLLLQWRRRRQWIISVSVCALAGHYVLQDTCSQTQGNKWAHALKTPIHLSILGVQFSLSCFSSVSPNGWLNQLCSPSIQVLRNACLLPTASQRARRKQGRWWRSGCCSSSSFRPH